MMHELLDTLHQNQSIGAFGFSLLHSLWQGVALSILLWLLLKAAPHLNARIRYWLAFSTLCSLLLCFACTFYLQLTSISFPADSPEGISYSNGAFSSGTEQPQPEQGLLQALKARWDLTIFWAHQHIGYIFLAWIAGFTAFSLRFFGGLYLLRNLRQSSTLLPDQWSEKVAKLQRKLGLPKQVQLLTSDKLSTPLTFGWLRPVIIFPLSLISLLPEDQVETILLHELAHIQRNDYLINLLQSLVETIFFFNPGYWYLSALLEREREFMCDDLVVAQSPNAHTYARALANLAELTALRPQALAMNIADQQNNLLFRIKRILTPSTFTIMENSTNRRSYQLASFVIALSLLVFFTIDVNGSNEPSRQPAGDAAFASSAAQRLTVQGMVMDMHGAESLAGVAVKVKHSDAGTITDKEGNFSLRVRPEDTLSFSLIGYQPKEVAVAGKSFHVVILERLEKPQHSRLIITDVQVQENSAGDTSPLTTFSKAAVADPGRVFVVSADASIKPFYAYISNPAVQEPDPALGREISFSALESMDKAAIQSRLTISSEATGSKRTVTIIKLKQQEERSPETAEQAATRPEPLYVLLQEGDLASTEPDAADYKIAFSKGKKLIHIKDIDPSTISAIHVAKSELAKAAAGVAGKNGIVFITLKNATSTGVDKLELEVEPPFSVYPNPTQDFVNIRFYNEHKQPVKVTVLNPAGEAIHTFSEGILEKGWHQYRWNAAGQPAGMYSILLTQSGTAKTKKLLLK